MEAGGLVRRMRQGEGHRWRREGCLCWLFVVSLHFVSRSRAVVSFWMELGVSKTVELVEQAWPDRAWPVIPVIHFQRVKRMARDVNTGASNYQS